MRESTEEFRRKALRVHAFLHDVPLHDVWSFNLRGGEERTLEDFQALISSQSMQTVNNAVNGLFRLRLSMGRRLGWDPEEDKHTEGSYVGRLTDDDRRRSLEEPGAVSRISGPLSMRWPPVVYAFENESLYEIMNATGHHFLHMSMEPSKEGYIVYWAIYTKRTSSFTPMYMALIDPFRRLLVYPAMIGKMERQWAKTYAADGKRMARPLA